MALRTHEALSRTSRLINEQFFGGQADERRIGAALPELSITIGSDERNVGTAAAQTLVFTLATLIARMGISVRLELPDVALVAPQPPATSMHLRAALAELGDDLIPGVRIDPAVSESSALTFVIGDAPCADVGALRLTGGDWRLAIEQGSGGRMWEADLPFGAIACAAAAAAEALRAALPEVARLAGAELQAGAHRIAVGSAIRLDLRRWFPGVLADDIGAVDAVSGGAIVSGALFALLRLPRLQGSIRVIEAETLDLSNVNRYMLSRASLEGVAKTEMLRGWASPRLDVTGVPLRFEAASATAVGPLAERVLVGVDHIPSRWLVQRSAPGWVGVGATQSLEAVASAHRPGEPCAGCLHPHEPDDDELVPTISFVSLWSGLLLALELLTDVAGATSQEQALLCWPFGYDGPYLMRTQVAAQDVCPVGCTASRALRAPGART